MEARIVICDDEVHILRAVEFKLRHAGYEVEAVENGELAWQAVLRKRPALLITDCQMPRLDGISLVRRIREHQALCDLPVIILSAKELELPREELTQQLGVQALVGKPFSPRDLLRQVSRALGEGETESKAAPGGNPVTFLPQGQRR